MKLMPNDIVTLNSLPNNSSNTFIVDSDEGVTALLSHPLLPTGVMVRADKKLLNTVHSNIKDSTERCIDYANSNKKILDYNTSGDLEGVAIYFAIKRQLTPRQKQTLAGICGVIASVKFNNDLREAMNFVTKNSTILDDFNLMWYTNFKGLFTGEQTVTSKKQRSAIFNIAGYALAELENPTAKRRK